MWRRRDFLAKLGLGMLSVFTLPSWVSKPTPAAASQSVLTVTGRVRNPPIEFSLEEIDALEQKSITTETPWYIGKKTFRGPTIRTLLDAVGADGSNLVVQALNDYQATIPVSDVRAHDIVLATRLDGEPMSIREKGPLFVIYPFDDEPELKSEQIYSRCVWQVRRIDVI